MPLPLFGQSKYSNAKGGGVASKAKGAAVQSRLANPRAAAPLLASQAAAGQIYQVKDSVTGAATKSYSMSNEADAISITFTITANLTTGNTTTAATTDVLNAISELKLYGQGGLLVDIQPSLSGAGSTTGEGDFYQLFQRYSPYHAQLAVTSINVATTATTVTVTGSYDIPWALPAALGPYTMQVSYAAATAFTVGSTLTTNFEVSLNSGDAGGVAMHAIFATQAAQPSESGVIDLSPIAPIQDVTLDECVITGNTTNTSDIAFAYISVNGKEVAPNVTGAQLVAVANAQMSHALYTDTVFLCFGLKTQIAFGRTSHTLVHYNSSAAPATSGVRELYVWFA
jgi:hypothetical protein